MDQRLNIIFSGDGSLLSKTINQLETDLKGFEQELKKTNSTDAFKGISGKIAETTQRLNQLKGASQGFSNTFKGVTTGSQSATFALTNLGRVAQDLPFGFLGIANNLNPLLESFQRLKVETGSTGGALKALRASLTGAAGVGLGLSVVSSLLISFGDDMLRALSPSQKFADALKEASESMDKNAASVVGLVGALKSDTLTTKEAVDAKKELIKLAPEFQNAFEGNKLKVAEGDKALEKYVEQLIKTTKVTAAFSIFNKQLQESIATIAEGGKLTFGQQLKAGFVGVFSQTKALTGAADDMTKSLNKAKDALKPENLLGSFEGILKKLGLSFDDVIGATDEKGKKLKKTVDDIRDKVITSARQFVKEFGDAFVLPDLSDSFFKTKDQIFKASKNLLSDVAKFVKGDVSALKIKVPIEIETSQIRETLSFTKDLEKLNKVIQSLGGEVQLNADDALETIKKLTVDKEANIIINEKGLITSITRAVDGAIKVVQTKEIRIPVVTEADIKIAESLAKEVEISKDIIDGFFKSIGREIEIPITIIPDLTLAKGNLDKIEEKLNLRKGFSVFGDFGFKEFNKIDFTNINAGIAEGTEKLREMMDVANTLNQAIGQGLVNAFDAAFDAVLEGKSVFKALGEAVKQLVVGTIKAVAQMLILKAVTSILFPGSSGIPLPLGGRGGVAAPSFGGGVGGLRMAVEFTGQLTGRGSDLYGTVQQGQAQIGRVR